MQDGTDNKAPGAQPPPDPGFTPQRDRKMIIFSCLTLLVMTLVVFVMLRARLIELNDVVGANTQVALTDPQTIRDEASLKEAADLVANPAANVALWLESSGFVVDLHDKKGDPIHWDNPDPALGSVYWLDCGLPVTAVKPSVPVCNPGDEIRFWGQIAETDVAKLELSDEIRDGILARFGLQKGQRIGIFFASEIELVGRGSPLGEEHDPLSGLAEQ